MADLGEATTLVWEALQPLEAPDRRRVLAAAQALLGEDPAYVVPSGLLQAAAARAFGREFEAGAQTEPRKPVPVPVEHVEYRRPKARGRRPKPDLTPVLDLIRSHPGATLSEIRRALNLAVSTTHGYLQKLLLSGEISGTKEDGGKSTRYYPCQKS